MHLHLKVKKHSKIMLFTFALYEISSIVTVVVLYCCYSNWGTFTGFKTLKDHAFLMYLAPASKIGFKRRTPLRQ
jgi:hypothetical protein